jgi:hypothetical protein
MELINNHIVSFGCEAHAAFLDPAWTAAEFREAAYFIPNVLEATIIDEKHSIALENLLNKHLAKRKGESARRLKEGLGHAEEIFLRQVW